MFNVFRRSGSGYCCYQEPIHEIALYNKDCPDELLQIISEKMPQLRHPHLEKPYYQELYDIYPAWRNTITKSIIYDEYFTFPSTQQLSNYLLSLIDSSKGTPVIQECRTSNRIKTIKNSLGGRHIYLWRNSWDQWWSFKTVNYFDAVLQLVINANPRPAVIERLSSEINFVEYHNNDLAREFDFYIPRVLTPEESYLIFFVLWCLGWMEAKQFADVRINIDLLSSSIQYRNNLLENLDDLGIDGLDFSDCNIHSSVYTKKDVDFFQKIEERAYGLLLSGGLKLEDILDIQSQRKKNYYGLKAKVKTNNLLVDLERSRSIILRQQTESNAFMCRMEGLFTDYQYELEKSKERCETLTKQIDILQKETGSDKESIIQLVAKIKELEGNEIVRQHDAEIRFQNSLQKIALYYSTRLLKMQKKECQRTDELRLYYGGLEKEQQQEITRLRCDMEEQRVHAKAREFYFKQHEEELVQTFQAKLEKKQQDLQDREKFHAAQLFEFQNEWYRRIDEIRLNYDDRMVTLQQEIIRLRQGFENEREQITKLYEEREEVLRANSQNKIDKLMDVMFLYAENAQAVVEQVTFLKSKIFWPFFLFLRRSLVWQKFDHSLLKLSQLSNLQSSKYRTAELERSFIPRQNQEVKTCSSFSPKIKRLKHFNFESSLSMGALRAMSIEHITELFILDGRAFVTEAYRNLLDREPDEHGLAYYLGRMAQGFSKESIIVQLARSKECNKYDNINGVKQLIDEERRKNHWLFKWFVNRKNLNKNLNQIKFELNSSILSFADQFSAKLVVREKLQANTVVVLPMPMATNGKVPKVVHRIYFENYPPFRDPFLHYLKSWERELPQYQIMKWGQDNVDTAVNEWMRRSAAAHDPVFLSEFVRWDVLKKYGGIYLDADCEVLNGSKFNQLVEELDNAVDYDAFVGVEEFNNGHPTAQTVAVKKGAALVEFMHSLYSGPLSGPLWHWRGERGLIGPQLISLYFREHGLTETKGFPVHLTEPVIIGRVKVYPQEYFSPKFTTTGTKLAVNENTCIYHLFANLNVKDVDPDAEKHRREPMLFNDYCDHLSKLNVHHNKSENPKSSTGLRKLHRIYFGFDGKPDPYGRYLETWIKQMPGYEICHWNANNLPLDTCEFTRMMHEYKEYSFLSDYFRWWILREHGGIYLDADIEITNGNLLDQLVNELELTNQYHSFIGIDCKVDGWYTAHSMACKKGSALAQFMCEVYEGMGHLSLWRRKIFYFLAPQLTSLYFATNGWNVDGMGSSPHLEKQIVVAGVKIYPQQYFSPMRPTMENNIGGFEIDSYTQDTCICHHFSCTWHEKDSPYRQLSGGTSMKLLDEIVNIKK